MKMGKLDSALSDFSKACELQPTAAVYHYQKASLLHHRLARCVLVQQKRVASNQGNLERKYVVSGAVFVVSLST